MAKKKPEGLGDELFGTRLGKLRDASGPTKGEFVPPPEVSDIDEIKEALPEQEEFWRPPARFGTVPVEANPLGWDSHSGFGLPPKKESSCNVRLELKIKGVDHGQEIAFSGDDHQQVTRS